MKRVCSLLYLLLFLASIYEATTVSAASHAPLARGGKVETDQNQLRAESSGAGTVFWNKARTEYELGEASKEARERSAHLRRAEEFAQQGIKAHPQSDEGYKWLAIALGAQTEDANVMTQIRLSRRVKENIDKALAIDPDDDISLLVLSRWHYKIASLEPFSKTFVKLVYGDLPPASLEKAESLLLRAIGKKDRIAHRYSLAKVYYRMGRRESALEQLRVALTLPVTFAGEAEDLVKARKKLVSWK